MQTRYESTTVAIQHHVATFLGSVDAFASGSTLTCITITVVANAITIIAVVVVVEARKPHRSCGCAPQQRLLIGRLAIPSILGGGVGSSIGKTGHSSDQHHLQARARAQRRGKDKILERKKNIPYPSEINCERTRTDRV